MTSKVQKTIADYYLRFLNWFYPNRCVSCQADLRYDEKRHLCQPCRDSIHPIPEPFCIKCGIVLHDGGMHCNQCKKEKFHFTYVRSSTLFENNLREVVHQFKYSKKDYLAEDLSELLYETWKRYPEIQDVQTVVPVPLYVANLRERGFNQSKLLAEQLVKHIHHHYREKSLSDPPQLLDQVLIRVKKTNSQTKLSKKERVSNVESAFSVKEGQKIDQKKILLIDDVCTTGSTLNECAKVLKEAGAKKVYGLTLARD